MLTKSQIEKLREVIEILEDLVLKIEKGAVNSKEFNEKFYGAGKEINEILKSEKSSEEEWKIFDNRWGQKNRWQSIPRSDSYAGNQEKGEIEELIKIIQELLEVNSIISIKEREWSFTKSEIFEARRFLMKILRSAQNKIIIIDNYLDDTVFDFLEPLDPNISIFLLTDKKKPIFKQMFIPFALKRGNIWAKFNNQCHDRYIIIDDKEFYALGASINTIGNKDFMVHKIEDPNQKRKRLSEFSNYWKNGAQVK